MRDRVFYTICFGFVFGVLVRSLVAVNIYFVILLTVISCAIFLFLMLVSRNDWGILISIFILLFSFGILRFHMADKPAPYYFESQVGQKASFTGIIVDEPDTREASTKLTVLTEAAGEKTKVLLSMPLAEYIHYGDEVTFFGKLEKPENFITDQGKEFDYVNYLKKDGILYMMNYPQIEIISSGNGNIIKSGLFFIKSKFLEKLNLAIPAPESLLMAGLILGEKSSFSPELRENFVDTGTIHIIALSGYNVTIVAEWFMKLFASLPRHLGIGAGIFAVVLFILMTGASSTALRAGVMAVLALIARATGRNYDVARALILAGVSMILLNPFILVYDVSFQLSFVATVAVIFFAPRMEKYFQWVPKFFKLRDIISVTFAVYIFVLPFILYKMGNLSLVALPANFLILPFIPFTMFLGFLTSFIGLISYILSVPLGYITYLLLHYELGVIDFFANVPFAAVSIPNFPLLLTVGIYLYFSYMLFIKPLSSSPRLSPNSN